MSSYSREHEVLIKAENVSKKFSRRLRQALWYGVKDLTSELLGRSNSHHALRKGEFWALDDVSFELKRGECLGLIGRNGAGKSTLLKLLNGLIKPDKGRITVRGRVGALIELGAGFNPILTGRENIHVNASVLGIPKREIDKKLDAIIEFAEIEDFIDTPVQYYSSGMKVRLGFAIAAQMEPDVLLIDEVLAVGDIGFTIKCLNVVGKLLRNSAVVFVSHAMQHISRISTNIMVLKNGKVEYYDNDVGGGLDYYISKFETARQRMSGSGKATVSDVIISSGYRKVKGEEVLLLDYGAELSIEMSLTLDSSVGQPGIRVIICNQEMRDVADCSSQFCGFEISAKRFTRVKLKLENLQLNMGIYSITIGVIDLSSNEILCREESVSRFQVKTAYTSWAHILLPGTWKEVEP